ncbi:tetratricopeptide repeat protein [Micromonospora rubida]|uniref:tetratricopeptide repeat protein n=1 Tax=Micromonospora rubida TaxID=2697657 RepID=UPI00191C3FE7|nr:tetratricopeptide repeat protein [Micromonospora rubida]NBE85435.1 hypothetical protein [Micromonospora rubida]
MIKKLHESGGGSTTRSSLAFWRGETGDAAGAVTAFEKLLTDQLRVLGPDHPDSPAADASTEAATAAPTPHSTASP